LGARSFDTLASIVGLDDKKKHASTPHHQGPRTCNSACIGFLNGYQVNRDTTTSDPKPTLGTGPAYRQEGQLCRSYIQKKVSPLRHKSGSKGLLAKNCINLN
jgi:hypothetical protein